MIKILAFSAISLFLGTCSKVDLSVINNYVSPTTTPTAPKLSNEEVVSGLKEALNVGIKNAVNITSVTDGFLKNESIRLPFPPDAIKAKQKAIDLGMTAQVEKFETTLNRAAEEASKEAILIFADAITNMSIQDLKEQTTAKLTAAFSPKVADAISKVKLTEYWSPIMTKYNTAMTLTGGEKINPDLNAYVTQKAIEGLFKMVALEENKIRKDPVARVSDLLIKVFGSL
jgi:D-ribose pyranose/furanose isomerase RbsD